MASRPLTFGIRYRENGRTVRVRPHPRRPDHYLVEVQRRGRRPERREHASLLGALRGFAAAWRGRLH